MICGFFYAVSHYTNEKKSNPSLHAVFIPDSQLGQAEVLLPYQTKEWVAVAKGGAGCSVFSRTFLWKRLPSLHRCGSSDFYRLTWLTITTLHKLQQRPWGVLRSVRWSLSLTHLSNVKSSCSAFISQNLMLTGNCDGLRFPCGEKNRKWPGNNRVAGSHSTQIQQWFDSQNSYLV